MSTALWAMTPTRCSRKSGRLSSMTPTIILQGDRPELIVGAAGGPRIISATLQTILNVLDFRMPVKEAVEAPRIHHQWIPDEINVEEKVPPETKKSLERRGHAVERKKHLGGSAGDPGQAAQKLPE